MCCADAGDPISADNATAAPKNGILIILLLLNSDPSIRIVREQERHHRDDIPGKAGSAYHALAIRISRGTRPLDCMSTQDGLRSPHRHCERSEAINRAASGGMDCFVASLLAMTWWGPSADDES